ncbi:MAG: signal peptidase I [Bacillota bacterium]
MSKRKPVRRVLDGAGNIVFACLLLVMVVLVFYAVKSKVEGGVPTVAGHKLYLVLSGSMSPTFDAGSIVAVKPVAPQEVRPGDIITFKDPDDPKTTVTHRVVKASGQGGALSFITKGDANDTEDLKPLPAGNVIGKVSFAVPYAGYLANFAKSKKGLLVLMILPGLVIIAFELRSLFRYVAEAEQAEKLKKEAHLREEVQPKT